MNCLLSASRADAQEGQRVVVTGGGRGIGRSIALLCASEGARVAVVARSESELEAVVDAAGGASSPPIIWRAADVTDEAAVEAAITSIVDELGGIDVLINNAGGGCTKAPLHEQSAADFRKLLDLNVISVSLASSRSRLLDRTP
jgi:3-oxoacyl-[acyl-carrier protein] reductase